MAKNKRRVVKGKIPIPQEEEFIPHTQYKRLSKEQYIKFLSKYKDLDKTKRVEIAERAFRR